ncbi:hypothetical protein CDIK_0644 [Cucumispora dikerogammari]|nr:hypothetical protein CDIK_0644 [Cucumispora dikerogammari]
MTDLTQIFRDTISPDKSIRNNAEQQLQELLKSPEFISSLPMTYMVSPDEAVAQVSSTIYKNNINKISNKEVIIRTSIESLIKLLTEKNIAGLDSPIYKLHSEVLKRTVIKREMFEFAISCLNVASLNPENYVNNILMLEILFIEVQRTANKKPKKAPKNTFQEFLGFFINLIQSPFNKETGVYYTQIFEIFKYVCENYKWNTTEDIIIIINECVPYCENVNSKTTARKFAQEVLSTALNSLFDSHDDRNKVWENALCSKGTNFSMIDRVFELSYKTLLSFIQAGGIETLDYYGKAQTDDITDILFACACVLDSVFGKKQLCGNYASRFPRVFEEIYMPFMALNTSKIDLFLNDEKEFYTATNSSYIEGLSDLFETATIDFIECCNKISSGNYTFTSSIYEHILQKCISYDNAKLALDPQTLISLNDPNLFHNNIINNPHPQIQNFIQLMKQKYVCLRLLSMLSYGTEEQVVNFPSQMFTAASIKTALSDFQGPINILRANACFFLEQFYPEDANRYTPEFINATNQILDILMNNLIKPTNPEPLKLIAIQAMTFFIDERSNSDVIEHQKATQHQRKVVVDNMSYILNTFITIKNYRSKEVLDCLMVYFPDEIKIFVPPLIEALAKQIDELESDDKELITEHLISIGELILMISLLRNPGMVNMTNAKSNIEATFNYVVPMIQKNLKDTHYLPEFIIVLSNFAFSMCNPLPIFPYFDQIMQFPEEELINVMTELEEAMDNIISFINPYVFYGPENLIKFIEYSQMTKYVVSFKCIPKEEFNSNFYIQMTEERNGKIVVKQDLKNDLSPLVIGAIDYLAVLFSNNSLIDMMNQQAPVAEKTSKEKTEKILSYVNRFKQLVFENSSCVVVEEIVLIAKIYEALALNLISKDDTHYFTQIMPTIFTSMMMAIEKVDEGGEEAVFICNVFFHLFIRNPALIQQIGSEKWKQIIEIMKQTKSMSSRLHERTLILLFFSRIFTLPIEQIFSTPSFESELRILAGIFSNALTEHFEYVTERYFMTEEETDWNNGLYEDPSYQSVLDHVDVIRLLRDIIPNCAAGSLFVHLVSFIPDENREKSMGLLIGN